MNRAIFAIALQNKNTRAAPGIGVILYRDGAVETGDDVVQQDFIRGEFPVPVTGNMNRALAGESAYSDQGLAHSAASAAFFAPEAGRRLNSPFKNCPV
jgi:hypothetical protein